MAGDGDCRHGEALERVGVSVRVGRAVRGQVAGVAGLFVCGGGAVVAALGVSQDLRGAGDLRGGRSRWEGLCAGGVPHRLWRRGDAGAMSLQDRTLSSFQKMIYY